MEFNLKLPTPADQTPILPPETKKTQTAPDVSDIPISSDHIESVTSDPTPPSRDPHRRPCEYEPSYDWRTDPYYDEEPIRERLKAAKPETHSERETIADER